MSDSTSIVGPAAYSPLAAAPAIASARVVVAAAPGTLAAAVAKAALAERVGVTAIDLAEDLGAAASLLPADLLLVDVRLAAAHPEGFAELLRDHAAITVVGLADRPDDLANACMSAAGLTDVVLATDGQAAIAMRLRLKLESPTTGRSEIVVEVPAPAPPAPEPTPESTSVMPADNDGSPWHADETMRHLAGELEPSTNTPLPVQIGPDVSQVRSLEIALDRRQMDLMVLGGVARSLTHADQPLADLCAAGQRLLDSDTCLVCAPCGGATSMVIAAAGRYVHPGDVAAAAGESDALAATLRAGDRVFVADARDNPAVPQLLVAASRTVSMVIEPVMAGERLLGSLVFGWQDRIDEPAARETALLRVLAAEAANAIERQTLLDTMRESARIDPLTGLPNRAAWDERLTVELARAARTQEPVSLVLLDVDGFTAYNERFGKAGGDNLLRAVARAWRTPLRATDMIARVGADEFAILLPDCSADDAEQICERLHFEGAGVATFGAALTTWDGQSTAEYLMACAESALAQARAAA